MKATLTTPSGRKIRSASLRRYVLVADYPNDPPAVRGRSDNLATVEREQGRLRRFYNVEQLPIYDTETGRKIR